MHSSRRYTARKGPGNWLSFLYVWQVGFTAPLSIASGCIGLSGFLAVFWPGLDSAPIAALPVLHYSNFAAAAACLLVTALLYRNLSSTTRLAWVLFAGVIAALAGVIVSGFAHAAATGGWHMPPAPPLSLAPALGGLAQGTLLATYCYWGYYNITFLGAEVRRPERTIPRAILLSVFFVASIYIAMNLSALPSLRAAASQAALTGSSPATLRMQLVADIARSAFGPWAGYLLAALIVWTAFSSVFSLLLGYSRVPYAAARDGNYFSYLAAVHPKHGIPHRSLVALGLVGAAFCFFSLAQVITMLRHHAHLAAVLAAAGRRDRPPHSPSRSPAPLPHSALPAAASSRHGRLRIPPHLPRPRSQGTRRRRRYRRLRHDPLSLPRPPPPPMALRLAAGIPYSLIPDPLVLRSLAPL